MGQEAFKAAALSEIGLRETNQDSFVLTETGHGVLLAVCDGVGGLEGGAQASAACAKAIQRHVEKGSSAPARVLEDAIEAGHRYVLDKAAHADLPGMSTTAVVALISGGTLRGAWVGDSRLGVLDSAGFHWLTEDHVDRPGSSLLVRAIGMGGTLQVANTMPRDVSPGDVVIVCSDGVHGVIDDTELFDILSLHEPSEACRRIQLVLSRRAADDNATAVVCRIEDDGADDETREIRADEILELVEPVESPGNPSGRWLVVALAALAALVAAALLFTRTGAG